MMKRILTGVAAVVLSSTIGFAGTEKDNPMIDSPTWADLKGDIVGDVQLSDGTGRVSMEAPFRAFDAATVPVHIAQPADSRDHITTMMLVIDENPSPLVATFTFGKAMYPLDLETRVRVNQYSNIRAIATTETGDTLMVGRYVKASGGCSAPAAKDAAAAMASLGRMKLKQLEKLTAALNATDTLQQSVPASGVRRVAQVMIKHPNYSGLQRDQMTHLFISPRFIDELEVYQGEELLFKLEAGISISTDPSFRFTYTDNGADTIRVRASDTEGEVFEQSFPVVRNES